MAALTDLQVAPLLLSALMSDDPRLQLVNAIAWLDPARLTERESDPHDIDFDYDAEDDVSVGLYICRECFPAVYAGAVQLQWQGLDERAIGRYLLHGINAQLVVPVQSLDELRYGPPVAFCGVSLPMFEPEDTDQFSYDQLLPLFALFGLSADEDRPDAVEQAAYAAARVLIESLTARAEPIYQDLAHLLTWLFSTSGNTAVDYTAEVFWENGYDTAEWSPADIALINEINGEAQALIASALNAVQALDEDNALRQAFSRNVKAVLNAVRKTLKKGNPDHARTRHTNGAVDPAAFIRHARWPDRT